MERVIVISTDSDECLFVKSFDYYNDDQLADDVYSYIEPGTTFFVIYKEDLDLLEEALEDMEAPVRIRGKLTFDDVKTIRSMVKSGDFKVKEVAANYGVSRQTIWKVCKGI